MEKTTITEALAEVRLIGKKIEKKRAFVLEYRTRLSPVADPYANEGGTAKRVEEELQSMRDLGQRLVQIRAAIAAANQATTLRIGNNERSITEWLAWRREIGPQEESYLTQLSNAVRKDTKKVEDQPPAYKDDDGKVRLGDLIYNVNQDAVDKRAAEINETLGVLDGKLSLLNATTVIEF